MAHYEHEKTRAVEYISAMHKAMDGVENFEYYSPTARITKLKKDQLERYKTNVLTNSSFFFSADTSPVFHTLLRLYVWCCFVTEFLQWHWSMALMTSSFQWSRPRGCVSSSRHSPSPSPCTSCPKWITLRWLQTSWHQADTFIIQSSAVSNRNTEHLSDHLNSGLFMSSCLCCALLGVFAHKVCLPFSVSCPLPHTPSHIDLVSQKPLWLLNMAAEASASRHSSALPRSRSPD